MNSDLILARLRRFLLILSVLLFGGAFVELWLTNHWESAVQLIPFFLCGLGAVAALLLLVSRPRRAALLALRAALALVAFGSLFGVYEHVEHNFAFVREVYPNAPTGEVLKGALGGANPLLAPGVLAVAAVLAFAATYGHPALNRGGEGQRG